MNLLVVIGGPTAAGKTSLAIRLAQHFKAEIVSADSRQFYREMNIGTAKPDTGELSAVPHHLIDSLSVHDEYDIGRFERDALLALAGCFSKRNVAFLVGGSGLYLDAVINGLDELPGRDPSVRKELEDRLNRSGISTLQEELKKLDPETAQSIDLNNPHRLIRAIELCRITGQSASQLRTGKKSVRDFQTVRIAIAPERKELYDRIDKRVTGMLEKGLVDEVRKLSDVRSLNALHTVGYNEIFEYLDGIISLEEATDKIRQHTRNYAKRQMTWFRNKGEYEWFGPDDFDAIAARIRQSIAGT